MKQITFDIPGSWYGNDEMNVTVDANKAVEAINYLKRRKRVVTAIKPSRESGAILISYSKQTKA